MVILASLLSPEYVLYTNRLALIGVKSVYLSYFCDNVVKLYSKVLNFEGCDDGEAYEDTSVGH
jgi:hypothetical protein